jgi:uncharacterized membrane protein
MSSDKKNKTSYLTPIISILSALGVILSLYLTYIHFSESRAAFCAAGTDCDTVRQSVFSTILGVPVASIGVLGYAVILVVSLVAMKKRTKWLLLYIFSLAGFIFSAYLTYLELFVIKAICMYCVFSAALMTVIFIVLIAAKSEYHPRLSVSYVLVLSLAVAATVILGAALVQAEKFGASGSLTTGMQEPADSFQAGLAMYMAEHGAVMYGSYKCPHCNQQKQMFGDAFKYIKYVECNPKGENANPSLCLAKGIMNYPTWEIDGRFYEGAMPLEQLSAISGYDGKF